MSTILDAMKCQNNGRVPVWFMRQAGRYLPEYMEIKKRSNFREMSHTPELMKEITLQPMKRYDLDAAIMFSDILTCLEYMGAPFQFTDTGPKLSSAGPEALTSLTELDPPRDLSFVGEGLSLIKKELTDKPVLGFIGAPFTLASYLIEGGTSREFIHTRRFMLSEPKVFQRALNHLADQLAKYIDYQIDCGVSALQVFDSWGGILPKEQYEEFVLPSLQRLYEKTTKKVPFIQYGQPTSHLMKLYCSLPINVLSVDWRLSVGKYAKLAAGYGRKDICLQGNIDPIVMSLKPEQAKPYIQRVLDSAKEAEILNRFVLNVGHGVTPLTNTDTVKMAIDLAHSLR